MASRLNNNLSGILTIKSFTKEKWELNRLNEESLAYQRSNKAAIKLSSAFIPLIRFAILFAFYNNSFDKLKFLDDKARYLFLIVLHTNNRNLCFFFKYLFNFNRI